MELREPPPEAPTPPPSLPPSPWTGRDLGAALLLLLLGYAGVIVVITIVALNVGDPEVDSNAALAAALATLGFSIWLGAIVLILATRRNLTLGQIGFRSLSGWSALWPLGTWIGGMLIVFAYGIGVLLLEEVTGNDLSRLAEGNPLPDTEAMTDQVWFVLGLSVVFAAPLGEELFFRGLVFRAIQSRWGLLAGMVISGLLFSLVHFNVSVVLPFWGIGILFAYAYHRSGSLWTPVVAHAIFNGVSFLATVSGAVQ